MTAATEVAHPRGRFPPTVGLLIGQIVAQLRFFVRIPAALFFTLALPTMMLVLFNLLFAGSDATIETRTGDWGLQQFYVGSLGAFEVVTATFTNLANMIPDRRQDGVMKRWRGTPLPPSAYLAGFVGSAVVIAAAGYLIVLALGFGAYGLEIGAAKIPALLVTFLLGVAAWSALGVAVAGVVRSPEAAPAVANAIILPLAFVSNTFVPIDHSVMPAWLDVVTRALPLRPFVESMQAAFNPTVDAPGFDWGNLAVLAAWGVVGAVVAATTFKWDPVADAGRGRGRGRRRRASA